ARGKIAGTVCTTLLPQAASLYTWRAFVVKPCPIGLYVYIREGGKDVVQRRLGAVSATQSGQCDGAWDSGKPVAAGAFGLAVRAGSRSPIYAQDFVFLAGRSDGLGGLQNPTVAAGCVWV